MSAASPRRRALVVGIDRYPAPNTLHGCVADARAWRDALLRQHFAVTVLTDRAAERALILAGLRDLAEASAPGDVAWFVYSGHGTQLPDTDGDEGPGDGYDEAIVPVDALETGAFLVDDDLRTALAAFPAGASVTAVLDSCFSGTACRLFAPPGAAEDRHARYLAPTEAQVAAHRAFRRTVPTPARPFTRAELRWAEFAACQPTEVSYEAEDGTGQVRGAFSRVAAPRLAAATARRTRAGLLAAIRGDMGPGAHQRPMLDAAPGVAARGLWTGTAP